MNPYSTINFLYQAIFLTSKQRQYSHSVTSDACNTPLYLQNLLNPGKKEVDFGEDMGILGIITIIWCSKYRYTLRLGAADKWSTRISLKKRQKKDVIQ